MRKFSILVLTFGLGACSSGPKYKIDDSVLASVPVADKAGVLSAQNEQNQAQAEVTKAKADLESAERDLDIAENEYKAAKLNLDTAKLNQKAADESGDVNRKNSAARDVHVADMGVQAADAKVDWLEKKVKWQKYTRDAAEAHTQSSAAKYELEKAKLAAAKNIKPSDDFNVMNFESESLDKQKRYSDSEMEADRLKPDVDGLERKYTALSQQYNDLKNAH